MTCNLINNKEELQTAFASVNDSKTGQEWAIFEYDANSNILKVGAQGTGGIHELLDNFQSGKIQYGFGTVAGNVPAGSTNQKQRKLILIHWQGGVPATRLAITASHLNEITAFVQHVSLVINARSEEDLDRETLAKQFEKVQEIAPNAILPKMDAQETGMPTPFIPPAPLNEQQKTKTAFQQELDPEERERFWSQQRDEEEARKREEAERRRQIQEQAHREQTELAAQLHKAHLEKMTEKAQMIKSQSLDAAAPPTPTSKMGKFISGRTQMFEQKVAELTNSATKPIKKPKDFKWQVHLQSKPMDAPVNQVPKPLPKQFEICVLKRTDVPDVQQQQQQESAVTIPTGGENHQTERKQESIAQPVPPPSLNSPPAMPVPPPPPALQQQQQQQAEQISKLAAATTATIPPQTTEQQQPEQQVIRATPRGGIICAKAIWDYQAEDATELTFNPDDIITDIQMVHDGWWYGRAPSGALGLFPSNYVQLIQ